MGLPTGFLEIERKDRPYEKVEKRLKSWKEFVLPLPAAEVSRQGARCMDCGIPFCHNGCPVNNLIPDWNELVRRDRWRDALEVLHSTNNFPEFTGRICPAPCEAACTLNIDDNGMGDMLRFDAERLRILVERHHLHTGSARARELLEDWDNALKSFIKVMPKDYKRALLQARDRAAAKAVAAE